MNFLEIVFVSIYVLILFHCVHKYGGYGDNQ
jgi:hypothetical protein